jgi:hypothetical protein
VPLRHVRAIQPGHVVDVTAESREFTATVSAIVPAGEPLTQSFEVLVKAPPVDGLLSAGTLLAGDRVVVRGGESLRGKEKLEVVGIFEAATPSATIERSAASAVAADDG